MRVRLAGMALGGALAASRWLPVPVIDEEHWLYLAAHAPLSRPYDWWRPGPPWGDAPAADAFVFAHPPGFNSWLSLCQALSTDLATLRVLAALPWALLLGYAVGWLCEAGSRQMGALAAVLSMPVVVLVIQRGLMPDLMAGALALLALASWLAAWRPERPSRGLLALGGLALAAAAFTRYPALMLAPVLLADAVRRRKLAECLPFWLLFLVPWLAGESWLRATYGRWHLLEVLSRAGEIPRGPWEGRLLGALTRLGLALGPLALLGGGWRAYLGGFLLGGGALALGWPGELATAERMLLLGLAVLGGVSLVRAADLLYESLLRCSKTVSAPLAAASAEGDAFALCLLALLVCAGVVAGHNYAAPRYLLVGLVPLALLMAHGLPPWRLWLAVAAQSGLALVLSRAEADYAVAADAAARELVTASPEPGVFTGEWTFRWSMERAGWTFVASPPAPGALAAVPANAGPSWGPTEGWEEVGRASAGEGGLRVLDLEGGVGLYAETLGPLPFGLRSGPLEEVALWRVR